LKIPCQTNTAAPVNASAVRMMRHSESAPATNARSFLPARGISVERAASQV